MRTPPKSKIDRLLRYHNQFQDYKAELKSTYSISDNYLLGQLKVAASARTKK